MLDVRPVIKGSQDLCYVKKLYTSLFPRNEQIPMPFLLWRAKKEVIDFLAFYDES